MRVSADLHQQIAQSVAFERAPAGETLVSDHAERPQVGTKVDGLVAASLLRADVKGCSQNSTGFRATSGGGIQPAAGYLGDAEIEHLRDLRVALLDDEHIVRLQIAVHDAGFVCLRDRARYVR